MWTEYQVQVIRSAFYDLFNPDDLHNPGDRREMRLPVLLLERKVLSSIYVLEPLQLKMIS